MGRAVRWPMAFPPLPPLLLLLVAVVGTIARPQAPPIVAPHESEPQGFYAPDAWRPVTAGAADTGAGAARSAATLPVAQVYPSDSYGLRIDQDRSRVRVEDTNRSGREDTNSDHSPSAATSSTTSSASTVTTTAKATLDDVKATTATPVSPGAPKANAGVPTPSPLGASIHRVTSQLLTAADDVRTPPKLRHQQESRDGQGMAVPVILEEDELEHPEEILTRRSPLHPGASPSTSKPLEEGISTWVLLSGSHNAPSSTQPSPSPSSKPPATPTTTKSPASPKTTPAPAKITKAPQKNAATTTTTKRPPTKPTPTPGKVRAPSTTRKPQTNTTAKTTTVTTTVASTTTTTSRPKPQRNKTTEVPALAPAMTRKPPTAVLKIALSTTTNKPVDSDSIAGEITTLLPAVTETPEEENPTTEDPENKTETSTRRTRRPGPGGKKKKNKNKRRKNRPGNNSTAIAESKIGEAETNSTTKPQNKERPLSTRIYNYLAREVMPSFGVGLLGLAITAGLAGLIMYPFGGGAVRRTYEVDAPNLPQHGNFYYYGGEYDGEDHGQAEESVIRKVFEGMNTEAEQAEDSRYASQRYPAEGDAAIASGTVTTYAGDVQANRYPTHRYDTSQPGYNANSGTQNSYNTGTAQSSYNTRQDGAAYYNVDQSSSYYSPGSSSASSAATTGTNSTESGSSGGRVRYREVATGTVIDPQSPNPQQITKKSDYYAYNTGRVRYRDVGTGEVLEDTPRVRFREVGSDTVHYSMSEPTSNDGGVEHGPRHVRVKRQLWDMKEMAKTMEKEDKLIEEQARKMMDESKQMQKELDIMHAKKNKPKKATEPSNKTKSKQDGPINVEYPQNDVFGMNEDMDEEETATSDIMDAEFLTGAPETTEVEIIAVSDDMPTVVVTDSPKNGEEKPQSETVSGGVVDEKLGSIMEESNANVEESTSTEQGIQTTDNPSDTETPRSDEVTTAAATPKPSPNSDCSETTSTSTQKVPTQSSNPQINLIELIKKIAQLKVQLGINLLKTTSQAFTNYLDNVQKRMENVIREAREASSRRTNFWNYRRFKREAQKKQTKKMKRKQE